MNLSSADLLRIRRVTVSELPEIFAVLAREGRLPLLITFVKNVEDPNMDFIEPGMMGCMSGVNFVKSDEDGAETYRLHFYLGDHKDHNKKLFKCVYKDDFGKQKLTALDKNKYSEYAYFDIDGETQLSTIINVLR